MHVSRNVNTLRIAGVEMPGLLQKSFLCRNCGWGRNGKGFIFDFAGSMAFELFSDKSVTALFVYNRNKFTLKCMGNRKLQVTLWRGKGHDIKR